MIALYPGKVIAFDRVGALAWGPIHTGEIKHFHFFVRIGDGWVAWETYRDEGRARVLWDLPQGAGRQEVPLGSGINDLAVAPDGALIAVSTSGNLSVGSVRGSLFVLRTRNGAEVYRRYFRKHARARVAFLGARHLAVTHFDPDKRVSWIEVLRIPPAAAGE